MMNPTSCALVENDHSRSHFFLLHVLILRIINLAPLCFLVFVLVEKQHSRSYFFPLFVLFLRIIILVAQCGLGLASSFNTNSLVWYRYIGVATNQDLLGAKAVAGFLMFATVSGILMALFLNTA